MLQNIQHLNMNFNLIGVLIFLWAPQVSTQLASSLTNSDTTNSYCFHTNSSSQCQLVEHNNLPHTTSQVIYDPEGFWRFSYVDEQADGFQPIIREQTIDERLANVIHIVSASKLLEYVTHDFASGDPEEDEANLQVAGSSPAVDDEMCGQHLRQMLDQMDELSRRLERKRSEPQVALNLTEKDYRLARVLDSFGRYEPGHLLGKTHAHGHFKQCSQTQLLLGSPEEQPKLVNSRYCWAKFKTDKHLHWTLKQRKREEFDSKPLLWAGICIPESCHSKSFRKHPHLFANIANSQFKLPQSIYLDQDLQLDSVYCLMDSDSSFGVPLSGQLWFWFVGLWTLLVLYCTFFATLDDNNGGLFAQMATCLDLRRNWADFLESKQETDEVLKLRAKVNFDTLNPIKVMGTLLVVLGHCFIVEMSNPMDLLWAVYAAERHPMTLAFAISTMVVDSFLVITGILLAYVSISKIRKWRPPNQPMKAREFLARWAQITCHRFLRLLPLFYLAFWFQKGVFIYLNGHLPNVGSGFNVETLTGACRRETWLSPLIGLAAFTPISRQCLPQTWSVSVDLFFALTVAPVIVLYVRRPKMAAVISALLCLLSIIWAQRSFHQMEAKSLEQVEDMRGLGMARMFNTGSHLYTWPHLRFCSIMVGIFAGYHLLEYSRADGANKWPVWLTGTATKVSLLTVVGVLFVFPPLLPLLKMFADPYHKLFFVHALSTLRLVWSAANGVIFLRMVTDWNQAGGLNWTLARLWKVLVKLNYSILLIHVTFLIWHATSQETFTNFVWYDILGAYTMALLFCLPLSVVLHVLFENPIDKIIRLVVHPAPPGKQAKSTTD